MRILIITDAYPPEVRSSSHLMKEMADGLRERGHSVYVATSFPTHNLAGSKIPGAVSEEDGITVIRTRVLQHHNVSFIQKGISQLLLPHLFFRGIRKHIRGKIDVVFVHSPPLPLATAARLVQKRYGAKYCLNVQDFFPQNAIDLGVLKNKFLIRFFERMERRAYRDCDFIVTPSEGHKKFLVDKRNVSADKISVVPHWIDPEPFLSAKRTGAFRKRYGLEGKFIFLFGGVFGPSQGLQMFIEIAKRLKKYHDMVFLFVGDGSEKDNLVTLADSYGLKNVAFKPLVSKEEYPELVKDADVGILSLTSDNTTPAVPAKLMGYMMAGVPVLAFLHPISDGIAIVKEAECGLAAVSDDMEHMTKLTERMYLEKEKLAHYGASSQRYALAHFTKEVCVRKLEGIFECYLK